MIKEVIEKLISDTDIQDKVGVNKAGTTVKVFPVVCPQGETAPYVTCSITGSDPIGCKEHRGLPEEEYFDIITYAEKYDQLDDIEHTIVDVLNTLEDDVFSLVILQSHKDMFDNDRKIFARVSSFKGSAK